MRNKNIPQFSVVVPVYNAEKYIDEAIQSVLNQTEKNFEILLVNDGSTDTSGLICDKLAQSDCRIKAFHQENLGQIAARECGIKNASGEYVLFLDSDDLLIDTALECLSKEICENQPDCIVFGFQQFSNVEMGARFCDRNIEILDQKNDIFYKILSDASYNSMCRKAFRKSVMHEYDYSKFYPLRYGEDLVQSVVLLQNCKNVIFLDKILYYYRIVSTSISHKTIQYNWECRYNAREVVFDLLSKDEDIKQNTLLLYKRISTKKFVEVVLEILSSNMSYGEKIHVLKKIKNGKWNKEYIWDNIETKELSTFERIVLYLFEGSGIILLSLVWTIKANCSCLRKKSKSALNVL